MDSKLFLIKAITLLYRDSIMTTRDSAQLVKELVSNMLIYVKTTEVNISNYAERDLLGKLKNLALEMTKVPDEYQWDKNTLLISIRTICMDDEQVYDILERAINDSDTLSDGSLKRSVSNLIKDINNFYIEEEINKVLSTASYKFLKEREKIKDVNAFVADIITKLEPLQLNNKSKDPAIKTEIDLSDSNSINTVFNEIKKSKGEEFILKTGWQAFNRMSQGGLRRGEFVCIPALQHKYKTGFTLSLFKQIALYNKPHMLDINKKPLLLRLSFEDDMTNNLEFLYTSLKSQETQDKVNLNNITSEEMTSYIIDKLGVNGYNVKMLRIDPSEWSYRHICNKILELEALGFEIHLLMIDYLGMVPTTGCNTSGPMGTDMRDLFRRIRNFCGPRKITCVTPHQISPEGKRFSRSGVDGFSFVKEINGKGYYSGSAQLDQEIDLEVYIHLVRYEKNTYLTVQRGKHRLSSVIPESDQYFILKFSIPGMPIPDDIDGEDTSVSSVASQNPTDDLFRI